MSAVTLMPPSRELLPAYADALRAGWSPSTTRDMSEMQLADIAADPDAFLDKLLPDHPATLLLADGTPVPRLPGATYWIWDGAFCGSINYRHVRGTEELPSYVSGHVGYSVIAARRRRGIATTALRLLLPIMAADGLRRVSLTCDEANIASRRVIEANGGVCSGTMPDPANPALRKLHFWILISGAPSPADTPPAG